MKKWICPRCGLTVDDEAWRHEKPERTVCCNGHRPTRMILHENVTRYLWTKMKGDK